MIKLAAKGLKTVFCVDRGNRGITRTATAVVRDLRYITDEPPEHPCNIRVAGVCDPYDGTCANANVIVVAGIVGIDKAVSNAVDCSALSGKRECYTIKTKEENGRLIIYIAGSDLLGAEYGLLRLSELAGVSPWHYFADVLPVKRNSVDIEESALNCTSKEPAIRLRGFFLNDEWPSLGGWVHEKFGGFNELFYEHVFDLLLRLRGNFLWPAMWSAVFSEDGYAYPTACAELADTLGITMGTSHHEPLFRAGEEFSHTMTDSNSVGYGKDWSYYSNERGLYDFWDHSVKRNKDFKSLVTVGMRGERDSKILGENATLADNIELLKKTITDQKKILRENGLEDAPKVLALYKEVEDYFYGDSETAGLKEWKELDDVMFLLSDDNFANTRTLPSDENRERDAGWGLYYHFDYHGDPISYEWVNSTPITKAWEQLTMAYDYGIKNLWVVNVGDLRPVELPLSYFMLLAFDYDVWSERNKTGEYLRQWTAQQFCRCDAETMDSIERILNDYTRLNGDRRPEATHTDTFSLCEEYEAVRELERASLLESLVADTEKRIPEDCRDAFTGLVSFPASASANLRKMMLYAGMYNALSSLGCSLANLYHEKVEKCIERDKKLEYIYNNEMANGKWRHMMSSKHVAFINWNDEGSDYPHTEPISTTRPLLACGGETAESGSINVPVFTSVEKNVEKLWLFDAPGYEIKNEYDWIDIQSRELGYDSYEFTVSVNWDTLDGDKTGSIEFLFGGKTVTAEIYAHLSDISEIESGTFIESSYKLSMEAEHFSAKHDTHDCSWEVINNYGKGLSCVKCFPNRRSFSDAKVSPRLEYRFYIEHPGDYTVTCVIAPTNNLEHGKGLRYALMLDGGTPEFIDTLPQNYAAGSVNDEVWKRGVLDNCRRCKSRATLSAGYHTLSFCHVDAGIVLQKIELAVKPSKAFYGYRETKHK